MKNIPGTAAAFPILPLIWTVKKVRHPVSGGKTRFHHRLPIIFALWSLCLAPAHAACTAMSVQEPVVAGTFYPADPAKLRAMVNSYLDAAGNQKIRGEILGLIAPHAGFVYSGPAAGHAYAEVRNKKYDLVVVIAPFHAGSMTGVSILNMDAYRTPLGDVPIDRDVVRALMDQAEWIRHIPALFIREHSIEVHLPFLQTALDPDFAIVPVVMGSAAPELALAFADVLAGALRNRNVLFVASSDMSHYHGDKEAREMDLRTLDLIGRGDLQTLARQWFTGQSEMCGSGPVQVLMRLAQKMGIRGGTVLNYQNSGDTAGDRNRVVGYGSVAFVNQEGALNLTDKQSLLTLARNTLEQYVREGKKPEFIPGSPALEEPGAAFITLKVKGHPRCCIGKPQSTAPLYRSVIDMTVSACSKDMRFKPVQPAELSDIRIEISVMSPLMKVSDIEEIRVGRDGLYLSAKGRSGALLPQAPVEQGWNRDEYLENLCRKSGMTDRAWEQPGAELYRFTTQVFTE
jgi:AmmeMemoRadiSam system protein B/AmmeMemoRadiSam system protein A